ncbi:unnamed protein product [Phytomonas sp. EM1]|nr:unnamed protein product [Phytomonas sp. EM1]|eukprot:CCW63380.1 unnamed protein product [Phytomonas sp. isolate EM1]
MWSFLPTDLKKIAHNIIKDSDYFIDFLGKVERDLLGGDGVYAGDEFTPEAKATPIPRETLLSFQNDDHTYCEAIREGELEAFLAWMQHSPLSSRLSERSEAAAAAGDPIDMDSSSNSVNLVNTYRQRLLDSSDTVLEKYARWVKGEIDSPRDSYRVCSQATNSDSAAVATKEEGERGRSPSTTAAPPGADGNSPLPRRASASGDDATTPPCLLSDAQFFDRYFFRLAQLRLLLLKEAQQKAKDELAAAEVSADATNAQSDVAELAGAGSEKKPEDPSVLRYAHLMMNAANTLATNIDSIFNNNDDNDDEDSGVLHGGSTISSTASDGNDAQTKVASLEQLVCELQEELHHERMRVRELTDLLISHHIEVPSFTASEPHHTPSESAPSPSVGEIKETEDQPLLPNRSKKGKMSHPGSKSELNSEVSGSGWEQINECEK